MYAIRSYYVSLTREPAFLHKGGCGIGADRDTDTAAAAGHGVDKGDRTADSDSLLSQQGHGPGGRSLGLGNGFVNRLRRVGQTADKDTIGRTVNRTQFDT